MSSLESEDLVEVLVFLRKMREQLISDFLSHEREIFIPMFAYENEPVTMDISIEKFFSGWLNEHFSFLSTKLDDHGAVMQIFLTLMYSMNQEHLRYKQEHLVEGSKSFVLQILLEKINYLESLLSANESSNKRYNDLLFIKERDRALFQRQLDNLKGKS